MSGLSIHDDGDLYHEYVLTPDEYHEAPNQMQMGSIMLP
jgi:hypothetical protein